MIEATSNLHLLVAVCTTRLQYEANADAKKQLANQAVGSCCV
jgi:hypothetical protein